jgi:putative transposase
MKLNHKVFPFLRREAAHLWNATVKNYYMALDQGKYISCLEMQKIVNSKHIHAHSADAIVQQFYDNCKAAKELKKTDPTARYPYKTKKFSTLTWKSTAIRLSKNGSLVLPNGRKTEDVVIPNWKHKLPVLVKLCWDEKALEYELVFVFSDDKGDVPEFQETDETKIVAVDIGQIHVMATSDGETYNGKLLRSTRQWKDSKQANFVSLIDVKKKGSNRRKKLVQKKRKFLSKVENVSHDILHKLTTRLVASSVSLGKTTMVVGDLGGYRLNNDQGKARNQENHSWVYGKITWMLRYKCKAAGIQFVLVDEAYTSKTCLSCGQITTANGRNHKCSCGAKTHRDILGACNIKRKYLGTFGIPSSCGMAPAFHVGVKYYPHMKCYTSFQRCRFWV